MAGRFVLLALVAILTILPSGCGEPQRSYPTHSPYQGKAYEPFGPADTAIEIGTTYSAEIASFQNKPVMVGKEFRVYVVDGAIAQRAMDRYQYETIRVPPGRWTVNARWIDARFDLRNDRKSAALTVSKTAIVLTFETEEGGRYTVTSLMMPNTKTGQETGVPVVTVELRGSGAERSEGTARPVNLVIAAPFPELELLEMGLAKKLLSAMARGDDLDFRALRDEYLRKTAIMLADGLPQ